MEKKEPKLKVGDEVYRPHRGRIEEVVLWDDGIIRYKIQGYGGLVQEKEC